MRRGGRVATVGDLLERAVVRLEALGIRTSRLDAELLLAHALGIGRASVLARRGDPVACGAEERFERLVAERETRVPVAYLLGRREFWSLEFEVNRSVLIPRPESEIVVQEAIRLLSERSEGARQVGEGRTVEAAGSGENPVLIADVGTGAGPIVVALLVESSWATAHATDLSVEAVDLARRNAARHGVEGRIRFHVGDLLTPVLEEGLEGSFDLVASNLPYVGASDEIDEEVRLWEPVHAVVAGARGHEVIARLLPQAARALREGGGLVLEIGPAIEGEVRSLLAGGGLWCGVRVCPDLAGRPRVVTARRSPGRP